MISIICFQANQGISAQSLVDELTIQNGLQSVLYNPRDKHDPLRPLVYKSIVDMGGSHDPSWIEVNHLSTFVSQIPI